MNMDRELELIQSVADLTKIVAGLQDNIKKLTESMWLMKERIEELEHPSVIKY